MAFTDIVGSTNLLTKTVDFSANFPVRRATKTNNAGTAPDGTNTALSVIADTNNNTHRLDRNPAGLSVSTQYTYSVHLKAFGLNHASLTIGQGDNGLGNDATCVYNLSTGVVESEGSNCDSSSIETLGNGWYRCSITLTLGGSILVNAVLIGLMSDATTTSFVGNNTDGILVWGPQLEEGANESQYLANDTSSTVQNAGSDGVWEFDNTATVSSTYSDSAAGANSTIAGGVRSYKTPSGRIQKVYIRTRKKGQINLFNYSEQFDNTGWTKINNTIVANSTTDPNGGNTADTMVENAGGGKKEFFQNKSLVSGRQYTMSVFAKTNGRFLQFQPSASIAGSTNFANFNLTTGALGTVGAGADSATITDFGNGWFRCSITMTSTTTSSAGVSILLIENDTNGRGYAYTGNGTSGIFVWGAMFSDGAILSKYIKTTNSVSTTIERNEVAKDYYDKQA